MLCICLAVLLAVVVTSLACEVSASSTALSTCLSALCWSLLPLWSEPLCAFVLLLFGPLDFSHVVCFCLPWLLCTLMASGPCCFAPVVSAGLFGRTCGQAAVDVEALFEPIMLWSTAC